MDTKKKDISVGKKGGRNPFGKVAIAAGGLIIGAGLAEAVGKWRTEHPHVPEDADVDENQEESVAENEELVAENAGNTQESPQEPGEPTPEPNEPQPIDPATDDMPAEDYSNSEESVDEVAQRIANSEEIDPADGQIDSFWNVGEHHTFYTEVGEIDVFDIELNDPNLAGYPFMLADTDGDGFYDTILLADGTPANIQVSGDDGEAVGLDYYIAQASITQGDLEEAQDAGGGYLSPDSQEDISQDVDTGGDMLDEHGNPVTNEEIAQVAVPPAHGEDNEDESFYLALLNEFLDDDEDGDGGEDEDVEVVTIDNSDDDSADESEDEDENEDDDLTADDVDENEDDE